MWRSLLILCVFNCLLRVDSLMMIPDQQRTEFNAAIRRPMLQQIGLEVNETMSLVQNVRDDTMKCISDIINSYQRCVSCLKNNYSKRYSTRFYSEKNALQSLSFCNKINYKVCRLLLDPEQQLLESINRATKWIQQQSLSVFNCTNDASLLLDVLQNIVNKSWTSPSAEALMSFGTPPGKIRSKRWITFMKNRMTNVNRTTLAKYRSFMKKYFTNGVTPVIRRTSRRNAGHARGKRWLRVVSGVKMSLNVMNASNTMMNAIGNIINHVPFNICGMDVRSKIEAVNSRLERTQEVFNALRTTENFIQTITYQSNYKGRYHQVSVTMNVRSPNVIALPSMNSLSMLTAASEATLAIMSGLMPPKH